MQLLIILKKSRTNENFILNVFTLVQIGCFPYPFKSEKKCIEPPDIRPAHDGNSFRFEKSILHGTVWGWITHCSFLLFIYFMSNWHIKKMRQEITFKMPIRVK